MTAVAMGFHTCVPACLHAYLLAAEISRRGDWSLTCLDARDAESSEGPQFKFSCDHQIKRKKRKNIGLTLNHNVVK